MLLLLLLLFSPSTAAPSIHRLALTLVSDGACGFAGTVSADLEEPVLGFLA